MRPSEQHSEFIANFREWLILCWYSACVCMCTDGRPILANTIHPSLVWFGDCVRAPMAQAQATREKFEWRKQNKNSAKLSQLCVPTSMDESEAAFFVRCVVAADWLWLSRCRLLLSWCAFARDSHTNDLFFFLLLSSSSFVARSVYQILHVCQTIDRRRKFRILCTLSAIDRSNVKFYRQ